MLLLGGDIATRAQAELRALAMGQKISVIMLMKLECVSCKAALCEL